MVNKPDYNNYKNADEARIIYEYFLECLGKAYKPEKIKGGAFQQYMKVSLVNDGPVTLSYDYNFEDLPKKKEWNKKDQLPKDSEPEVKPGQNAKANQNKKPKEKKEKELNENKQKSDVKTELVEPKNEEEETKRDDSINRDK
jgi:hypothetical protein